MTVVTASPNPWFVETDFGALLGPMPADALVEMARTGALLASDRVREGIDGSWSFANDVSGLFDGVALPLSQPAAPPDDPSLEFNLDDPPGAANASEVLRLRQPSAVDERSSPSPMTATRQAPLRSPKKPNSPVDVVASSADPLKELLESWPKERERQPAPSGAGSAPEELDFKLDTPLVESAVAVNPSSPPRSLVSTEREPSQTRSPVPPPELVTATEPTSLLEPPRKRPDIYAQYVAVYKELQQRRVNTSDQAGWNDFVAQARAEIEEELPWLESHAKPGEREKSLLLYVGRDLHEMLGRPRESEYPHQQRVDGILNQLQTIYTPSKSNERYGNSSRSTR